MQLEQIVKSKNDVGLTSPVGGMTKKSHLHPPVLLPFRLFSILHLKDNQMKQSKTKYGLWRNFRRADKRALVSQQKKMHHLGEFIYLDLCSCDLFHYNGLE